MKNNVLIAIPIYPLFFSLNAVFLKIATLLRIEY